MQFFYLFFKIRKGISFMRYKSNVISNYRMFIDHWLIII